MFALEAPVNKNGVFKGFILCYLTTYYTLLPLSEGCEAVGDIPHHVVCLQYGRTLDS